MEDRYGHSLFVVIRFDSVSWNLVMLEQIICQLAQLYEAVWITDVNSRTAVCWVAGKMYRTTAWERSAS